MTVRLDRLHKRILANISAVATVDTAALAEAVGCRPEVARDRVRQLREAGVLQGFTADIDRQYLPPHELLIVGVPGEDTTDEAIKTVSGDPTVARFFTLAAHASVGFVVRGDDLGALRKHADRLAREAGLREHQGILVVKTFYEQPHAGAPWMPAAALETADASV